MAKTLITTWIVKPQTPNSKPQMKFHVLADMALSRYNYSSVRRPEYHLVLGYSPSNARLQVQGAVAAGLEKSFLCSCMYCTYSCLEEHSSAVLQLGSSSSTHLKAGHPSSTELN